MKTFKEAVTAWNGGVFSGSRTNLAKAAGVSLQAVRLWYAGQVPAEHRRAKIAELLGITIPELVAMFPERIRGKHFAAVADRKAKTPIVGVVNGKDEYFQADFDTKIPMEEHEMPTTGDDGEKMTGVKISGKLGKLAGDGDYVYIGRTTKPENGSFVVVRLNEGHSFKKITLAGKYAILESLTGGGSLRLPIIALNIVGVVRFVLSRR